MGSSVIQVLSTLWSCERSSFFFPQLGPRAVSEKVALETEHAWAGLIRALVIQKKNKRLSAVKFCGWLSGAGTGTGTGAEITDTI